WFAIEYATQTGYGSLQCPRSAALAVTPPNDFQHLVVSGPGGRLQPYGGTIQALHCGEITTSPVLAHAPF
ncbi:MAG: hypothetical protein ACRDZQ_04905, partial [Acidimicrobiales bacterium]